MAIERRVLSLSLSPKNPKAARLMELLDQQQIEAGQFSETITNWLVEYLEGRSRSVDTESSDDIDDALDDLLDNL